MLHQPVTWWATYEQTEQQKLGSQMERKTKLVIVQMTNWWDWTREDLDYATKEKHPESETESLLKTA